ncbi:MAG: hypothetical protein ACRDNK_17220 [Solirubrobacteraceae bacterium]
MPRPPQLLSSQGEKVIIAGMAAGLLGLFVLGFAVVGAPAPALLPPVVLILLCVSAASSDVLHVRRHGWGTHGTDGPNGQSGQDPHEPAPQGPPGGGEQFDWDAFATQFRDHVERQPVA